MITASTRFRASLVPAVAIMATLGQGIMVGPQQPPPSAPKPAPPAVERLAAEWIAAARAHAAGKFDEPVASIARWPPVETDFAIHQAVEQLLRERGRRRAQEPGSEDDVIVIAKGLVLHTDIALAEGAGQAGNPAGTVDVLILDAKPIASRVFSIHWSHARVLARVLAKQPSETTARDSSGTRWVALARAWYRAAGAHFQRWADLGHLNAHLADADGVLGDDAVLLIYQGALHQAFADARLQAYRKDHINSLRGQPAIMRARFPIEAERTELDMAERALRRALALDASLVEARIRLAHVQDARGKYAEAAALARQALAGPLPAFLEYYGAMVLGRAETGLGDPTRAHAAFERAAACFPRSQAVRVALSHVAISGSPGMAADDLVRALGPDETDVTDDPWASYFRLHEPDAKALLEALRTSVP